MADAPAPPGAGSPAAGSPAAAHRRRQGMLLFVAALLCFASYDAFAKQMLSHYPAAVMNLSRYGAVCMLAVWVMQRHGDWSALRWGRLRSRPVLLARSLMLALVATCFMSALATMPLAEATAIYFTSPLIMVALSPWLLGERVGLVQWIAVLLGCAGMLLIVRPGNALEPLGTSLMAISAVCYAVFQVLTRKLSGVVATPVQFSYMAGCCLLVTALAALFTPIRVWPGPADLALLIAGGLVSGGAQLLLLEAFQRTSASVLAPMNYLQLLLAVLISTFWFERPPDTLALYGMLLIGAAGVYLAWPRRVCTLPSAHRASQNMTTAMTHPTQTDDAADRAGFSSIQAPDLVALVERQLLQAIFEGRLPPGARIVEAELSRQMGVSRAPLREAARRLESQGVLLSTPRKGFTVRTFSPKEIQDLFQVRLGLEVMAARLACEVASDDQLAALHERVQEMLRRATQLTPEERSAMDLGIHRTICALSGNEYLQRIFGHMQAEIRICQSFIERRYADPAFIAQSHVPLVEAIVRRDPDAAERALRVHLHDAHDKAHAQLLHDNGQPGSTGRQTPAQIAPSIPAATRSTTRSNS